MTSVSFTPPAILNDRDRVLRSAGAAGGGWHAYTDDDGQRSAVATTNAPVFDDPVLVRPDALSGGLLIARSPGGGALTARITRAAAGGHASEAAYLTFHATARLAGLSMRIAAIGRTLVWLDPSWLVDRTDGAVLVLQPATLTNGVPWPTAPISAFIAPEFREGGEAGEPASVYTLGQTLVHLATGRAPSASSVLPPWGGLASVIAACTHADPTARPSLAVLADQLDVLAAEAEPRRTVVAGGLHVGCRTSLGTAPDQEIAPNRDAFAVHAEHGTLLAAVASGSLAAVAGDAAEATARFATRLATAPPDPLGQGAITRDRVAEAVSPAMAITGAIVVGTRLSAAGQGATRALLFRGSESPIELTNDAPDGGPSELTSVVGEPTLTLLPGDVVILAGAGLRAALDSVQMAAIVERGHGDAQRLADSLVDTALRRGGTDPMTAVVIAQPVRGRDLAAGGGGGPGGLSPLAPPIAPNHPGRARARRQAQVRAGVVGIGVLLAAFLVWSLARGGDTQAPPATTEPPITTVVIPVTSATVVLLPSDPFSGATIPLGEGFPSVGDADTDADEVTSTTRRRRTTTTRRTRATRAATTAKAATAASDSDSDSGSGSTEPAETEGPAPVATVDGPIGPAVTATPTDAPVETITPVGANPG